VTELNGPHYTELKTSNLNPSFEFQQLLVSLKHVINLVMRIRDTGCHTRSGGIPGNASGKTSGNLLTTGTSDP
jgi:hypothetical protein